MKLFGCGAVRGRSGWCAALLLLAGLGSVGCNTYSYFEVHVKLEDTFPPNQRGTFTLCHVFVTGATVADFTLSKEGCQAPIQTNDLGTFDYSTFAESGAVMFDLKAFNGIGEVDKLAEGMTTLNIASGSTVKGDLTLKYTGPAATQ